LRGWQSVERPFQARFKNIFFRLILILLTSIFPETQIDKCRIILGDCLEVMRSWPDAYVDAILTSPPFRDADVQGNYYQWFVSLILECKRVARDYAIIFNSSTRIQEICRQTDPIRIGNWHKPGGRISYRFEPWFVYEGKDPQYNFNAVCWCDSISAHSVLRYKTRAEMRTQSDDKRYDMIRKRTDMNANNDEESFMIRKGHHPYENPLSLYAQLCRYFKKGGSRIICDPCLGSGTTLEACMRHNLKGIGIEKEKAYFDLACKRLNKFAFQERIDNYCGIQE
jgi:DNA modification methylase